MLPIFAYAQIHYYPNKLFKGLLFKKEPVIIIDIPKFIFTKEIPIYLIVKNSNKFPVFIENIKLLYNNRDIKVDINREFNDFYIFNKYILKSDYFGRHEIKFKINYTIRNKKKVCGLSNYNFVKKDTLVVYNSSNNIYEDFISADMHVHSIYTDDQVEFGSSIELYDDVANYINLDYFSITDHSYDLDDFEENYYKPDKNLSKWKELLHKEKIFKKMILGEEISCGNSKNKNIHLLSFQKQFVYGWGDSGEKLFRNSPNISLEEIKRDYKKIVAAHPFDKPGFFEDLLLNRGYYNLEDLTNIKILQILNSQYNKEYIDMWINMLINGDIKHLIAGNDSHGYLGWTPYIKFPLFKIGTSEKFLFGKNRTIILKDHIIKNREDFLDQIFSGKSAITTSIPLYININNTKLHIIAFSNEVFGKIIQLKIVYIYNKKRDDKLIQQNDFYIDKQIELKQNYDVIFCEIITEKSESAISNLIVL